MLYELLAAFDIMIRYDGRHEVDHYFSSFDRFLFLNSDMVVRWRFKRVMSGSSTRMKEEESTASTEGEREYVGVRGGLQRHRD
jgi:hypothetical protein